MPKILDFFFEDAGPDKKGLYVDGEFIGHQEATNLLLILLLDRMQKMQNDIAKDNTCLTVIIHT